jgi:hypothetical protein
VTSKVFLSHDHRDAALAKAVAPAIQRATLGQLDVWFTSDEGPAGGIQPGALWLDELRIQLEASGLLIALVTPQSAARPWLLFEVGFGVAQADCEVVPLVIGLADLSDLPFPLAMYQAFSFSDLDAIRRFLQKLLARFDIRFDEEMVEPVVQATARAVGKVVASWENPPTPSGLNDTTLDGLGNYLDKRFFDLTDILADKDQGDTTLGHYTVELWNTVGSHQPIFLERGVRESVGISLIPPTVR